MDLVGKKYGRGYMELVFASTNPHTALGFMFRLAEEQVSFQCYFSRENTEWLLISRYFPT